MLPSGLSGPQTVGTVGSLLTSTAGGTSVYVSGNGTTVLDWDEEYTVIPLSFPVMPSVGRNRLN